MNPNLSHALFHGTIETFKPGDIIKPVSAHAWATSDLQAALEHAHHRVVSGYGQGRDGEYPVHHGNVYEVEPIKPKSMITDITMSGTAKAVASQDGFRVKGQVASVLGRAASHQVIKESFPEFDPSKESYVKDGKNKLDAARRRS